MNLQMRQERERRGWSQEYVAGKLDLTPETIHYLETGQRKPSYDVLVNLLDLFGRKRAVKQIRELFAVVDEPTNL